jgi:hypothetical protein
MSITKIESLWRSEFVKDRDAVADPERHSRRTPYNQPTALTEHDMPILNELQSLDPSARVSQLIRVAMGADAPPQHSRLGAFKATLGFADGTVGEGVNKAIAGIYIALGTIGQDRIGEVFASPKAQALLDDPINSTSSRRIAEIEYAYWNSQDTIGGWMGRQFDPSVRDAIHWALTEYVP